MARSSRSRGSPVGPESLLEGDEREQVHPVARVDPLRGQKRGHDVGSTSLDREGIDSLPRVDKGAWASHLARRYHLRAVEIVGSYRVEGRLGGGGMGSIFRGRHIDDGRAVAIKRVAPAASAPNTIVRFEREAALAQTVDHPNVVRILGFGRARDGGVFIVMELLAGEDLMHRLQRGPLPVKEVVRVGLAAASGLRAAHEAGIVHRDIKPGNLFLCSDGVLKVVDFGLAIGLDDMHRLTQTGQRVGTPSYMAPEQILGLRTEDTRTDVWGLCATLFRALAGRPPFAAEHYLGQLLRAVNEDPDPLPPGTPDELAEVIVRGLRKDKSERWQSMETLEVVLGAVAGIIDDVGVAVVAAPGPEEANDTLGEVRSGERTAADAHTARPPPLRDEVRIVSILLGENILGAPLFKEAVTDEGGVCLRLGPDHAAGVFGGERWRGDESERAVRAGLRARQGRAAVRLGVGTGRGIVRTSSVSGGVIASAEAVLSDDSVGIDQETERRVLGAFHVKDGQVDVPRAHGSVLGIVGLAGSDSPLVGRDSELEALSGAARRAFVSGQAAGVLLVGPAGIGKSRLRHELEVRLFDECNQMALLRGHAESRRSMQGWHPLASVLRNWLRAPEDAPPEDVRRGLASLVPEPVAPYLGEILGADYPTSPELQVARSDIALMASRVRSALASFVDSIAAERPTMLVLEDLHWSDRATCDALEFLLRALVGRPLFVLATARSSLDDALCGVERRHLGPLNAASIHVLVEGLLGANPAAKAVEERSGGNPLFAEELAMAAQTGIAELPLGVELAVRARLEALGKQDRDLLRRAAVLGSRFTIEGLVALGEQDPEPSLLRLRPHDVVVPRSGPAVGGHQEWGFRNDLLRDVLYSSLTDAQRRTLHGAAGEWLTATGSAPADAAAHLEAAGLPDQAAPLWRAATARAIREGDLPLALWASERAVAATPLPDLFDLYRTRVEILVYTGGDQSPALDALEAASRTPEQIAVSAWRRSQHLRRGGRLEAALDAIRRGLRSRPGDIMLRAQELRVQAEQGQRTGDREWHLLAEARAIDAPVERAGVLWTLTGCMMAQGDSVPALPVLREIEALFQSVGHTPRVAAVRSDIAGIMLELHPPEAALAAARAAVEACRAAGNRVDEAEALRAMGIATARVGSLAEGLAAVDASAALAAQLQIAGLAVAAEAARALMLVEHGDPGGALACAEAALIRPREQRGPYEAVLWGLKAQCLAGIGRRRDARLAVLRSLEVWSAAWVVELPLDAVFVAAADVGMADAFRRGLDAALRRAERITDSDLRERFLKGTPARMRLLSAARAAGLPLPAWADSRTAQVET